MLGRRQAWARGQRRIALRGALATVMLTAFVVVGSTATVTRAYDGERSAEQMLIVEKPRPEFQVTIEPFAMQNAPEPDQTRAFGSRECPPALVTHSSANWSGGEYIIEGGFVAGEIAAATYTIPVIEFPVIVNVMEMIFAQNRATETTTTHWSVLVWEGTPSTGTLVATFSSDDVILPHIVLPPGASPQGVNVLVEVDPEDPEQIVVQDNGSHSFTVGFRIDQHHQPAASSCCFGLLPAQCCPPGDPPGTAACSPSGPGDNNVYPTVDTNGRQFGSQEWVYCRTDCGGLAACSGWTTTSTIGISGDWNIRATYTPFECAGVGACCLPTGNCQILSEDNCLAQGGTWQGEDTSCSPNPCPGACCDPDQTCTDDVLEAACNAGGYTFFQAELCTEVTCPEPTGACCYYNDIGGTWECWEDFLEIQCVNAGGIWQGPDVKCSDVNNCQPPTGACCGGTCIDDQDQQFCEQTLGGVYAGDDTLCADDVCVAGACCLPDGSCQDVIEVVCVDDLGGTFEGVGTDCGSTDCPPPTGACCIGTACVPNLSELTCVNWPGTWLGMGTDCGPPNPCLGGAEITRAFSCSEHGSEGEICLELGDGDAKTPGDNIDPRLAGVVNLLVEFDVAASGAVEVTVGCDVQAYGGTATATVAGDGLSAQIALSETLPDEDCCHLTLNGGATGTFHVRPLKGDVSRDGSTLGSDMLSIKPFIGQPLTAATAVYDIDGSGGILGSDMLAVKPFIGNAAPSCP